MKYCIFLEENLNGTMCSYCHLKIKSCDVTHLIFHLSRTNPRSNTRKLINMPQNETRDKRTFRKKKSMANAKKVTYIEDIRAKLHNIMEEKYKHVNDDDVYMHSINMHLNE